MKKYEDIIGLSRPVSKKHPPMSRENRAAQFAPFAALTGFEGAIKETARVTGRRSNWMRRRKRFWMKNLRYCCAKKLPPSLRIFKKMNKKRGELI